MKLLFELTVVAVIAISASAQSLNIDISDRGSSPSNAFAAQGLAGSWNTYSASSGTTIALDGLDGLSTNASLKITGFRNYQLLGFSDDSDLGRLASDRAVSAGDPIIMSFSGLSNGNYQVWTYIMSESFREREVIINSDIMTSQIVQTSWTGELILGQTHSFHMVEVTDGTLNIAVSNGDPFVNGIQLVIPTPSTLAMLGMATMFTTRRCRK